MARQRIAIISIPPGDAPLDIRRRWVGLELDLVENHGPSPHSMTTFSVMDNPKSWFFHLKWRLGFRPKQEIRTGYIVSTTDAVATLEQKHPDAARWWRENAPHLFGLTIMFPGDCCRLLPDNDA